MSTPSDAPAVAAPTPAPAALVPAEKRGRGRPPGSTNRPKAPAAEMSPRALAAAYQGLWLVLRFATWLVAGRRGAPLARPDPWVLDDLDPKEAEADAKDLLPFVSEFGPLVRVLSWIGGPVIVAKRIAAKLRRKPASAAKPDPRNPVPEPADPEPIGLRELRE